MHTHHSKKKYIKKSAVKICDHTAHHNSTMTTTGLVHTWEVCLSAMLVQWGLKLSDPEWALYRTSDISATSWLKLQFDFVSPVF